MDDNDEDEGEVRHVEYARPRPLLPKVAAQNEVSKWDGPAANEFDPHGHKW
jgi:hypothetical protein